MVENNPTYSHKSSRLVRKFVIRNQHDRLILGDALKKSVTIALSSLPKESRIRDEEVYLNEAIDCLSKINHGTIGILLIRKEAIQKLIYQFFYVMESVLEYSLNPEQKSAEKKIARSVQNLVRDMNRKTNSRLKERENHALLKLRLETDEIVFYVNLRKINSKFLPAFDVVLMSSPEHQKDLTLETARENLLSNFSHSLLLEYQATDMLLSEAASLNSTPEDEYFIQQVTDDYYSQIFSALKM